MLTTRLILALTQPGAAAVAGDPLAFASDELGILGQRLKAASMVGLRRALGLGAWKQMTLSDFATFSTAISGIAVPISLIYLAIQTGQIRFEAPVHAFSALMVMLRSRV